MSRILVLFFLILSYSSRAGNINDSTQKSTPATCIYKLDLFRAFQGTLQVSRESILKNNKTLSFGIMGTYASSNGLAKPYLKAQSFSYLDQATNISYDLDDIELLGFGANAQFRTYLGKTAKPFNGFYTGYELFLRRLFLTSKIDEINNENKDVSKGIFLGYAGYVIGYQKIIKNVVCFDLYSGGGFFYSRYDNEKKATYYHNNYQIDYTGFFFNAGLLIGITH